MIGLGISGKSANAAVINPGLWDFSQGTQGWISNNPLSTAPLIEEDGSVMLEAGDVSLYSLTMIQPAISVMLGTATKIRVVMKNETGSTEAKFFFGEKYDLE